MSFLALVRAVLDAVLPKVRYFGFYLYEITEDDRSRLSLRRVGDAEGYPDLPGKIDKLYGAHGVTTLSTVGSQVLVGFEGGAPERPYAAWCIPRNPVSMLLDADETIQIITTPDIGAGGPAHGAKHVYVGSHDRKRVARENDGTYAGELQFVPGAGIVQIVQIMHDGSTRPIGTLAASSLVFTPDPGSFGVAILDGHIDGGSDLLSSE